MSNPNNCTDCDHKKRPDGGWCYMFRSEPDGECMRHTARRTMSEQDTGGPALKPCPFCGGGVTNIKPNGQMWTGQRMSAPVSVSIQHWCENEPGQPNRMIERVGRDEGSAVDAWNRRAAQEDRTHG